MAVSMSLFYLFLVTDYTALIQLVIHANVNFYKACSYSEELAILFILCIHMYLILKLT